MCRAEADGACAAPNPAEEVSPLHPDSANLRPPINGSFRLSVPGRGGRGSGKCHVGGAKKTRFRGRGLARLRGHSAASSATRTKT